AAGAPIGRWSLFPGPLEAASREEHLESCCRVLLARYGVLFRDLLVRESAAPAWHELVGTLRRLELRGDVRGGRVVSEVAGEQYALPSAVDRLREARDQADTESSWFAISAADPLNLFGILTPDARVPATHRNALIIHHGRLIASRQAGRVEFYAPLD